MEQRWYRLRDFLVRCYGGNTAGLLSLVRQCLGREIVFSLPIGLGDARLIVELVDALERRNAVDQTFLQAVAADLGAGRSDEVQALATAWPPEVDLELILERPADLRQVAGVFGDASRFELGGRRCAASLHPTAGRHIALPVRVVRESPEARLGDVVVAGWSAAMLGDARSWQELAAKELLSGLPVEFGSALRRAGRMRTLPEIGWRAGAPALEVVGELEEPAPELRAAALRNGLRLLSRLILANAPEETSRPSGLALHVEQQPHVELAVDRPLRLGRAVREGVKLPDDDDRASRMHAVVWTSDHGEVYLRVDSKNGVTLLTGEGERWIGPGQTIVLPVGSRFLCGRTLIEVVPSARFASTRSVSDRAEDQRRRPSNSIA